MKTLPSGWRKVALHKVAEVRTGLALGRDGLSNPVRLPYLRVANVQDGYFDLTEVKTVEIEREEIPRYSLQNGDVLLTEGGDFDKLGRGHIWNGEIPNCLHQNHVFCVRPDRSQLDSYFLSCLTSSPYGRAYFLGCAKKSTNLASINSTQLKEMPLPLPELPEQLAIGERLRCWDTGIRRLSDLITVKSHLKRGLLQSLLRGRGRFREFARQPWQEVRLADVTIECSQRNGSRLGVDAVMAVTKAEGMVPMKEETIGASLDRYKVVRRDWFAYNPMRVNIGSIARWTGDSDVLVSPDYVVFRCKTEADADLFDRQGDGSSKPLLDPDFLDHFRRSRAWEQFVTASGNGSVRVRIYFDDLGQMRLRLPPIGEQKRIAAVLNTLDREIELLRSERDALRQQKKGLMQKLLTGEIRVKV